MVGVSVPFSTTAAAAGTTAAGAEAWVPLLAAGALENNAPIPRMPQWPTLRRKAMMLDSTGDGRADLLLLDSTGDGVPDQPVSSVAVDTTGDGRTDCLIADSNGDGRGDCLVLDTTGDGMPDTAVAGVLVDTDNDGQADVLLVDTTGDGVADTLLHIWGIYQHVPMTPRQRSRRSPQGGRGVVEALALADRERMFGLSPP
mgnify:FL=1